ncbi:MAG TPA: Stp1/IreP family PP2C-type Ser/Thr phosphatase [Firmicutes bacterium]|nr:Stp1/IreP family PP2C-type Ser/Thr phosphatase [Bacillota bacterium]
MRVMQASARTDVGLVRSVNEDDYLIGDGVFAVADGLGGHEAGEIASQMAIRMLKEFKPPENGDPAGALAEALEGINRAVYKRSVADPSCEGMGTTLTVLLITGDTAYIGHVGDSRAYLVRDGRLHRLTEDHSIVGELIRMGMLSEPEARAHPQRNLLTRAIGTQPDVEIEVGYCKLGPGDRFLLCTDGLTGAVDDGEILRVMASAQDPRSAVDQLVELAMRGGGHDNITAVAVFLDLP